jgi:glucose-6-phosphate 1-dehydrogenase
MPDTDLEPTTFVVFGATGDLAHRMVLPAFWQLAKADLLPKDWRLIGNGRGDVSHEDFRGAIQSSLSDAKLDPSGPTWEEFAKRCSFAGGGFDPDDPHDLADAVARADQDLGGSPQRVFYLAVPPSAFADITAGIGNHHLVERSRIVYEKPFGTSMASFRELDQAVHAVLDESQIFRIDHFLGKEATQDIHGIRFGNGLLERSWCRDAISAVQIDVPETLDVANRASFYDATGAILDMVVTHLFQIAAEVAMDPPASLAADDIAKAREAVIACFRPLTADDVVLGQYEGYLDIDGVPKDSTTETFVAARLWIDNDRWQGVPFLLRTGKCLAESHQRVSIILREPSQPLHESAPRPGTVLSFELSGSGTIGLSLLANRPAPATGLARVDIDLPLDKGFNTQVLPAYARLVHDILLGDRSAFTRPDGLESVWKAAQPMIEAKPKVLPYEPGSWGPKEAAALAGETGWLLGS